MYFEALHADVGARPPGEIAALRRQAGKYRRKMGRHLVRPRREVAGRAPSGGDAKRARAKSRDRLCRSIKAMLKNLKTARRSAVAGSDLDAALSAIELSGRRQVMLIEEILGP